MDRYEPVDNANADKRSIYDNGKYRAPDWVADKLNTLTRELAAAEAECAAVVMGQEEYIERLRSLVVERDDAISRKHAAFIAIRDIIENEVMDVMGANLLGFTFTQMAWLSEHILKEVRYGLNTGESEE